MKYSTKKLSGAFLTIFFTCIDTWSIAPLQCLDVTSLFFLIYFSHVLKDAGSLCITQLWTGTWGAVPASPQTASYFFLLAILAVCVGLWVQDERVFSLYFPSYFTFSTKPLRFLIQVKKTFKLFSLQGYSFFLLIFPVSIFLQ